MFVLSERIFASHLQSDLRNSIGVTFDSLAQDLSAYYNEEARDPDGRSIDPQRAERRSSFLGRLISESRRSLIEVGTGPGNDARAFLRAGLRVSGVDLSEVYVAIAREKGIDAQQASILALPFEDASFDAAWTMSTLVHVANTEVAAALSELNRVLVPGSLAAIGVWASAEDVDIERTYENEAIGMTRFFSLRTDASLRQLLASLGDL
jgi:ubiquinone/menaquinone biosynthesis C-methylase UbiE